MTDDMIDRVAHVLRETLWTHGCQLSKEINEELARAAIAAMRCWRKGRQAMTDDMVERVALAIMAEEFKISQTNWGDIDEEMQAGYRDMARAAIAAMPEPPK